MSGKSKIEIQRWFVFLGAFFFFPFFVQAVSQTPLAQYGIDTWDGADGLPQIRIRAVVQTRDGYLWLGTGNGLVRFDGVNFTTFGIQTRSLKENEIGGLIEDNEGALWIGTYGGGLTRFKDGQFTTFTTTNGLPDNYIRKIDKDAQGNLWFATPRGVGCFSNGVFSVYTTKDGLPSDFIWSVCADKSGGVFVVAGRRLNHLVNGKFVIESAAMDDSDGRMDSMTCTSDGSLWMTFESSKIKCWKNGKTTTYTASDHKGSRPGAIYEDQQGNLWIASRGGLLHFSNGIFDALNSRQILAKMGLVLCIFADQEGNLWLGTEANGLTRLRRVAVRTLTAEDGLSENSTRCIYRDHNDDIWVGAYLGFSRLGHGKITAFNQFDGVPVPTVTSIGEDLQNRIWIAAGGRLFTFEDGRFSPVAGWTNVFDIKVIARDNHGDMWIGTDGEGLFQYADGKFKSFKPRAGFFNNQIRAILCDHEGALWVGTTAGLACFRDGKFSSFTTSDGLPNNRVMSLYEDSDGALWIGTRGGLSRYQDGRFFNIDEKDGLPNSYVFNVLDDGRGNFWLSSGDGICVVPRTELNALAAGKKSKIEVRSLGYRDGLRSASLVAGTEPNACMDDKGQLLFCSLNGLVVVNPQNQVVNRHEPPVYIQQILINREEKPVDRVSHLSPGRADIEIHYSALSYVAPEKVRFKYKLEGIDANWIDAGSRRFAHYANLPPGSYRFQVIACNNDGIWNETGASYSFWLPPRFYQTLFFPVVVLILLATLALAIYRWRIRQLQRKELELRQRVDEAVAQVKVLSGLLPICSGCRKIRDDKGYWSRIDHYISQHADVKFSHGLCPDCLSQMYPEYSENEMVSPDRNSSKEAEKLN